MNSLVRRRLAVGAVAVASSLVVGLVVAPPSLAAAERLGINPNAVENTNPARQVTFTGQDTDFAYGATVTFNRQGTGIPFTVTTSGTTPALAKQSTGSATVNFTDVGNGLGSDGPADAGVYNAVSQGNSASLGLAPGGGSDTCTTCFTVIGAGQVSVASIAPNSLRPATRGNVSILGNNFERGTTLRFLNADGSQDTSITVAAPTTDNTDNGTLQTDKITTRTELKRRISVASGTTPGARDVQAINLDGSSAICSGCFFVAGQDLSGLSPTGSNNDPGQALTAITFTGPSITNGQPSLEFVGNPGGASRAALAIQGQNVRDYTGTSITADYDLANAAPQGNGYQPFVKDSAGVVNAGGPNVRFTVIQSSNRTPTLASMDSDTATAGIQKDIRQGSTVDFAVNGTNFSKGATVVFTTGTGLTVTSVEFVTPELIIARVAAAANAATGPRDAQVKLTNEMTSNVCSACVNVTTNASPTASSSATPSSTATSTISPSPGQCPTNGLTVRVNTPTINATGLASVTVSGAGSGQRIELQGYSQDHFSTQNFQNDPTPVDRTATASSNGSFTFNDLRPSSNTRLRARQVGCTYSGNTDVIDVRAQETLEVRRTGSLLYTFSGKSIPAREGGLIVSLYRITGQPCAAGVEPRKCSGETFIGQSRARSDNGRYSINIRFESRDRNTRDDFVVKTGRDAQNAPGRSNVRNLAIF